MEKIYRNYLRIYANAFPKQMVFKFVSVVESFLPYM